MRTNSYARPHTSVLTGILLSAAPVGRGHGFHYRVRIGHEGDVLEALSVVDPSLQQALNAPLIARAMHMVRMDTEPSSIPLLISTSPDPFGDGLVHLPECICPADGVVLGIKSLIAGIQTLPLRIFLTKVFQRRDVFQWFWIMPASAKHHHARPGGLAVHSLEVADDLAGHGGLTDLELDLGIAASLLHDIGKVWSYTDDMFLNSAGLAMGHELVGLSRLEPELSELECVWSDGAYAMRCLLSGQSRMRENGSMPSSILPRIKACDQRSCERDRSDGRQSKHSRPVWTPRAWTDQVSHGDFDMP